MSHAEHGLPTTPERAANAIAPSDAPRVGLLPCSTMVSSPVSSSPIRLFGWMRPMYERLPALKDLASSPTARFETVPPREPNAKLVVADLLERPKLAPDYRPGGHSNIRGSSSLTAAAIKQLTDDVDDIKHILKEMIKANEIQHTLLHNMRKHLPINGRDQSGPNSAGAAEMAEILKCLINVQPGDQHNDFHIAMSEQIADPDSLLGQSIRAAASEVVRASETNSKKRKRPGQNDDGDVNDAGEEEGEDKQSYISVSTIGLNKELLLTMTTHFPEQHAGILWGLANDSQGARAEEWWLVTKAPSALPEDGPTITLWEDAEKQSGRQMTVWRPKWDERYHPKSVAYEKNLKDDILAEVEQVFWDVFQLVEVLITHSCWIENKELIQILLD
ncbi:hypothetical protein NCC49_006382 [Naganishia albida]|nr:hypothetical protein NCC49_006382 [Naganishia albida]